MVAFQFIAHECPQAALTAFVGEAARILKPGGVICFVDNNPRSATIQNLPPALFTLMKSTGGRIEGVGAGGWRRARAKVQWRAGHAACDTDEPHGRWSLGAPSEPCDQFTPTHPPTQPSRPPHAPHPTPEPWSDEYYSFDLEDAMRAAGFEDVYTVEADHRHRAVYGSKPKA
jgi:SAM-dependent methyltransferase